MTPLGEADTGGESLTGLQEKVQAEQVGRLATIGWQVRLGLGVVCFLATTAFAVVRSPGWAPLPVPVGVYLLISAVTLRFTRRWPNFLLGLGMVLDASLIVVAQGLSIPRSEDPAGVAGFSLGLFVLLVAITGLASKPLLTFVSAGLSYVGELYLMHLANVDYGGQVMAGVVLAGAAAVLHLHGRRLRSMAKTLAGAEIGRQMAVMVGEVQQRRAAELDLSQKTISQMLEASREQNAKLKALQQDRDALTQLLVHDLRSPLSVVQANLRYVQQALQGTTDEETVLAVQEGRQVADRLVGMVGELLNIAKLESHQLNLVPESIDLASFFQLLKREYAALAKERKVTVSIDVPVDAAVSADRSLLTRTFENLLANALRYAPRGGRVQLVADFRGGSTMIAVRNDGTPIPRDVRSRLFQKFEQAGTASERRGAGFGLGLYFCRLVAEAHHGEVGVEDHEGWATAMVLRLPPAAAETGPRYDEEPPTSPSTVRSDPEETGPVETSGYQQPAA